MFKLHHLHNLELPDLSFLVLRIIWNLTFHAYSKALIHISYQKFVIRTRTLILRVHFT